MTLDVRNLGTPDRKVATERGTMQMVTIAGAAIVRAEFGPGWRWSADVGAATGATSCQQTHTGLVMSGRFGVRMDDGAEIELGPGDAHVVGPGHDAWVIGDEPCVLIDVAPAATGGVMARCHPCGVEFRVPRDDQLDHLVAAIQEHASSSHGHDVSREHILTELVPA